MTEPTPTPRFRIRWGWFLGCIVLGLAGILVGLLVAPAPDKAPYVASVLGGIGTTLLLIGIVVLLERRIVDTAVRAVRRAAEEDRLRTKEALKAEVSDFEGRVSDVWANAGADDLAAAGEQTRELADEFVKRVVGEYTGDAK